MYFEIILEKVESYSYARLLCLLACRQIQFYNCVSNSLKTTEFLKGRFKQPNSRCICWIILKKSTSPQNTISNMELQIRYPGQVQSSMELLYHSIRTPEPFKIILVH